MNIGLILFFFFYIMNTYVTSIREPPLHISQPSQLGNNSDIKTFWYNIKKDFLYSSGTARGPRAPPCCQTLHGHQTEQKQCCSDATRWQFSPLKDSRDDVKYEYNKYHSSEFAYMTLTLQHY